MPFTEDLAGFFEPADFGSRAIYKPLAGGQRSVNGIFQDAGNDPLSLVEDVDPTFLCAAIDLPRLANGDTLLLGDTTYKVRASDPDGTGLVRLKLEEQ